MADVKFSQFVNGEQSRVGDEVVGLRDGVNTRFDFPGDGIQDANGNYLLKYVTAGASAVNAIKLISSVAGDPVILTAEGDDTDIDISIITPGVGLVHIPADVDELTKLNVDNIQIDANTISATNTNGGISLQPDGSGYVTLDLLRWPITAGSAGQSLVTDGVNQLSFATIANFTGPSTDNAIARFDGTGGLLQNSGIIISDGDAITGATSIDAGNLQFTGNGINATNLNGDIELNPNGIGVVTINSTIGINAIIDDDTLATATDDNIATSLAIKTYIDSIASGISVKPSVAVATTANLTATYSNGAAGVGATLTNSGVQAALSIDGYTAIVNDRVLVKDQTLTENNGIYVATDVGSGATNWVLERATDYDQVAEINPGDLVIVLNGTTQDQSSWLQTETVATIGTDPILFSQFSASIPVSMANGGTGTGLTAANGGIVYSDANSMEILAPTATALQMLQSGSNAAPSWSTATWPATTTVNQILYSSSANVIGGITATASGAMYTNATGVPAFAALTDGQVLVGSTAGYPIPATLTAGTGISISNGANTITITNSFTGATWNDVTGTSQGMAVNNNYLANHATLLVTLTLPAIAAFGSMITVQGYGPGLFTIAQNAGQTIHFGDKNTTTGAGGSITALNRYNSITLLCAVANTDWTVVNGPQGDFTIV